jgi:hypothetical protein
MLSQCCSTQTLHYSKSLALDNSTFHDAPLSVHGCSSSTDKVTAAVTRVAGRIKSEGCGVASGVTHRCLSYNWIAWNNLAPTVKDKLEHSDGGLKQQWGDTNSGV